MSNPAAIPENVRRAVKTYVGRRRLVGLISAMSLGLALCGAIAVISMVADRYSREPAQLRAVALIFAAIAIACGLIGGLYALLRRHDAFAVAVRLDQAFPEHHDRWSSSIDLSERVAAGQRPGNESQLDRLFQDVGSLPTKQAASIVSKRLMARAIFFLSVAGLAIAFMAVSPAFDLGLLAKRFIHPFADLPRDSSTKILITEVNGQPFHETLSESFPEGSAMNLRVELHRKPGIFAIGQHEQVIDSPEQLAPRLTRETARGSRTTELTRAGAAWIFSQPRLDDSFNFRIRADDGQTQTMHVDVTPRIRLATIENGVKFPRYSRLKELPMHSVQGNRISVLADSVIEFHASFDRALQSMAVTYESIKADKDSNAPPTEAERLGQAPPRERSSNGVRRNLRVQKLGESAARWTLPADSSGVVRLRAVGVNGLSSEEWVCAVEAIPDAPPRILVTGLEPETTIVPGETVAFQYRAEDDLAVTDIVMDWSSAGGIHASSLGGEEYLRNKQLGQKVVAGQEVIQRMNYAFYGTEPFQFFINAIDSKGQEARSELFKIYTVSDDYATRFDRGVQLLADAQSYQGRVRQMINTITGQLKILEAAAGDSKQYDSKFSVQVENLIRTAQGFDDPSFLNKRLILRYGGVPYRLARSLQVLLTPPDVLATHGEMLTLASSIKTTNDLPAVLQSIRAAVSEQQPMVEAWGAAIEAEKSRFRAEVLLNQARGPAARLAALSQIQQPPEVAAANLKFYLGQIDAWLTAAAPLATDDPDFAKLVDALRAARSSEKNEPMVAALQAIVQSLSVRSLPPDTALGSLGGALFRLRFNGVVEADRFGAAVARMIAAEGQNELLRPMATLTMASALPEMGGKPDEDWLQFPASATDVRMMAHQVWETLAMYRSDLMARRFELQPQERADRLYVLRERAMGARQELDDLATNDIDPAARQRLEKALGRIINSDVESPGAASELLNAIRTMGTGDGAADAMASASLGRLIAAMRHLADSYDQHADAVGKEGPHTSIESDTPPRMVLTDQALRLQVSAESMESMFRSIRMLTVDGMLRKSPAKWSRMEELSAAELNVSLTTSKASESVTRLHLEMLRTPAKAVQQYEIIARNAKQLAQRFRNAADVLERWKNQKPIDVDYAQLMKDARAEGLFASQKDEFETVLTRLDKNSASQKVDDKLNASPMARVIREEQSLRRVTKAQDALKKGSSDKAPELIKALQAVEKLLVGSDEKSASDALAATTKEAASLPKDEAVSKLPSLQRKLQALNDSLSNLSDGYRDQLRLPALNTTAQQNRRFTSRDLPNVWTIGGVLDHFDRRWLYTMRDLDLSLTRTLLELAEPQGHAVDAADLRLQYGRMIEWRARNFANNRQRNQGISLLAADAGPTLRLPEHIAQEFMRARNLQTPEDFKPRIEAYYEELYRDLAK